MGGVTVNLSIILVHTDDGVYSHGCMLKYGDERGRRSLLGGLVTLSPLFGEISSPVTSV